jgi:HSP20 family protein
MAVIRWQPWYDIDSFSRQMEQLLDDLVPSNQNSRNGWAPAIELKSTEAEVTLRVELPGIEAKDLDIQVTREAVSISGEYKATHTAEAGRYLRSEFRYGNFHRVVPMPYAVQNDAVKAEFKDGILTLTLPRLVADRPHTVQLNLVGETTAPAPAVNGNGPTPTPTEQPETADLWAEAAQN